METKNTELADKLDKLELIVAEHLKKEGEVRFLLNGLLGELNGIVKLLKLAKESVLKGSYSIAVGYIDRALQGIGSGHDEQPKE